MNVFMQEALALARKGLGQTSPNPAVGALVVKDEKTFGAGSALPSVTLQ